MRRIGALAVCLAAACSAWAQAPEKCAITGRVVNTATGAPLKRAAVWVEAFSPARGVDGAPSVAGPSTVTDAQGRFSLENIDPGSYFLSARRIGYLDQGYGAAEPDVVGPPLKLAAGDRMGDITIKLTPQSLLYGKVTDEDGEAVPDAEVTVWRLSYAGGRRHLERFTQGTTQADGSVVIGHTVPGRYYMSASVRGTAHENAREIYVPTFYPSTSDPSATSPVEVAAGAEVRGLDIKLRKARTFRIRGRAAPNVILQLLRRDQGVIEEAAVGANTGRDGQFEFIDVLPGRYIIATEEATAFFALAGTAGTPEQMAPPQTVRPAAVEVTDSDLDDVELPVGESMEVTGRLIGGKPGMRPDVELVPSGTGRERAASAQIDAAGSFRFQRLFPAVYEVGVSGLAEDSYVKSIAFAGRDITHEDLDLTSGAAGTLEITLSGDGGEVAGAVRGADGKAMPGALVQVWPAGGESARSLKADENGAFRFRGLPPADYRVIAWEALDDDLAEYAPFRARFEAQATVVKVADRGRETVEVQAVARAASAAEAAKLR
jgi:protocatechuate 3,4-dioxygenase beta subunit